MQREEYLTVSAVANLLEVATSSVLRWADSGALPCLRTPGGHRRFLRSDVLRVLEEWKGKEKPAVKLLGLTWDREAKVWRDENSNVVELASYLVGFDGEACVDPYYLQSEGRFRLLVSTVDGLKFLNFKKDEFDETWFLDLLRAPRTL